METTVNEQLLMNSQQKTETMPQVSSSNLSLNKFREKETRNFMQSTGVAFAIEEMQEENLRAKD